MTDKMIIDMLFSSNKNCCCKTMSYGGPTDMTDKSMIQMLFSSIKKCCCINC